METFMKKLSFVLFVIAAFSVAGLCQSPPKKGSAEEQIRASLDMTAHGWNNGVLAEYLSPYTPDATEMTSAMIKADHNVVWTSIIRDIVPQSVPED